MNAAVLKLKEEGGALIRSVAQREPAKVVALKAGISPRHVYNLREEVGQPDLAWPHFLLIAMNDAPLRAFVAKVLKLDPLDPERKRLLDQLARYAANVPEEGDRENS